MTKFYKILIKYLGLPLATKLLGVISNWVATQFKKYQDKRTAKKVSKAKEELVEAIKNGKKGDISDSLHDL